MQGTCVFHLYTVDFRDDVIPLETGLLTGGIGLHFTHDGAGGLCQGVVLRDLRVHILYLHAEEAALDLASTSWSLMNFTTLMGTAKPTPTLPPLRLKMAVLSPTTSP